MACLFTTTLLFASCRFINHFIVNTVSSVTGTGNKDTESKGTLEIKNLSEYDYKKIKIGDTYSFRISFPDWSPVPEKVDVWYEGLNQAWKKDVPVVNEYSTNYIRFTVNNIEPHNNYKFYVKIGDIESNKLDNRRIYQKDQSITAELISSYEKEVKFNLTFDNYDELPQTIMCHHMLKENGGYSLYGKEVSIIDGIVTVDLSEANTAEKAKVISVYFCDQNCDVQEEWVKSNEINGIVLKQHFYIYTDYTKDDPDAADYGYRGKDKTIKIEFYGFETAPDKVDVYKNDIAEAFLSDVSIDNGVIQIPIADDWKLTQSATRFKLKSGDYESNILCVNIRDYITLETNKDKTYIGDDLIFKVDCGGLDETEIPAKINITIKQYQYDENGIRNLETLVDNAEVDFEDFTVIYPVSYPAFEKDEIQVTATAGGKTAKTQYYYLNNKIGISPNASNTNYSRGQTNVKYTVYFYGEWNSFPEKLYIYNSKTGDKAATGTVTITDAGKAKGLITFNVTASFAGGQYDIYAATIDDKYRSNLSNVTIQ